jgi:hypothetical protein
VDTLVQRITDYLQQIDWGRLPEAARDLWAQPQSNKGAALLFIGGVAILLLIIILSAALFVQALVSSEREDEDDDYEGEEYDEDDDEDDDYADDEDDEEYDEDEDYEYDDEEYDEEDEDDYEDEGRSWFRRRHRAAVETLELDAEADFEANAHAGAVAVVLAPPEAYFEPPDASSELPPEAVEYYEFEEEARSHLARWTFIFVMVVAAVIGFQTASGTNRTCETCHKGKPHQAIAADPHRSTACVSCHEYGRGLAIVPSSASRWAHILQAAIQGTEPDGYGPVTSPACRTCHRRQVSGVVFVRDQQLKVSHAEPIKAGAECRDCHTMDGTGAIGRGTRGMTTCLRCHDGKRAPSGCSVCHKGDPSAAVRDGQREIVFTAQFLVQDYRCYKSCHPDPTRCDACHGLRLPHSEEFMRIKHAKAAAFEKKELCVRQCHDYVECQACHEFYPGEAVSGHDINWKKDHEVGGDWNANCSCHGDNKPAGWTFCPVCHDERGAKP